MANVTAVEGLTALGDPTRRTIFERVAERPRAVGELARELPVSRPAVSQHLKVLKDAGLVVDHAAGTGGGGGGGGGGPRAGGAPPASIASTPRASRPCATTSTDSGTARSRR